MLNHNHTDTFLLDLILPLYYQLLLPLPELLFSLSNIHRLDLQQRDFSHMRFLFLQLLGLISAQISFKIVRTVMMFL